MKRRVSIEGLGTTAKVGRKVKEESGQTTLDALKPCRKSFDGWLHIGCTFCCNNFDLQGNVLDCIEKIIFFTRFLIDLLCLLAQEGYRGYSWSLLQLCDKVV